MGPWHHAPTLRLATTHDMHLAAAAWHGVFLAVSGFNNAGFALFSDNVVGFQHDALILLPIAFAVIVGGLGFPVLAELLRQWRRPLTWHLTTRIVVVMTPILLITGTVFLFWQEHDNPATLASMSTADAWLNAFFQSVISRTAGFNSIDIGAMHPAAWFGMDLGMFIGAGPAGTAPPEVVGVPLEQLRLRRTKGVTIIAEKVGGNWQMTQRDTVLDATSEILVAGTPPQLAAFGGEG